MKTKKDPLVSVIVTTKNEAGNIKRFFESIISQTYKNIELIVVDNNSSDKTVLISKKYTQKVFNYGPERSAQRNYGAKKSKGKYVLFLDADMELSDKVVENCVRTAQKLDLKILTIPEATVGVGLMPSIRKFEREMYLGDINYEVPRFFDKDIFLEYKGYDEKLTGPEDYDLPFRMRNKYKSGRIKGFIYHHEEGLTILRLLRKKYYYARNGAFYALKHPSLVKIQGTILFRKVYVRNWRKFIKHPLLGILFLIVRLLETIWAIAGFISAVGIINFIKAVTYIFVK